MATRVGIALGANLGCRLSQIREARDLLRAVAAEGEAFLQAAVYQSEPVDCAQGVQSFYNTVVEFSYDGSPHELLSYTQGIEQQLGRPAEHGYNAPREIDLDVLYFGDQRVEEVHLHVPHPRMLERRFVMQPLVEIRPDLVLPGEDMTIAERYAEFKSAEPPLVLVEQLW